MSEGYRPMLGRRHGYYVQTVSSNAASAPRCMHETGHGRGLAGSIASMRAQSLAWTRGSALFEAHVLRVVIRRSAASAGVARFQGHGGGGPGGGSIGVHRRLALARCMLCWQRRPACASGLEPGGCVWSTGRASNHTVRAAPPSRSCSSPRQRIDCGRSGGASVPSVDGCWKAADHVE